MGHQRRVKRAQTRERGPPIGASRNFGIPWWKLSDNLTKSDVHKVRFIFEHNIFVQHQVEYEEEM